MRAAPKPLEQRRRRGPTETGQAGTKWKKQNFGCKTRVEETRGSGPTGPWAQRSQGLSSPMSASSKRYSSPTTTTPTSATGTPACSSP
ncbi:hypothetical protein E2I00_019572 [Balaenoptera physalus]|uniref:Uncharacterized protein n=1 Tax=Balaenoptera physalus TaxID=9770 RepID=A0A6A1Q1G7_BALPH|nr:hypothetical protein E2I00_019572 [Balaenoptera physalus]